MGNARRVDGADISHHQSQVDLKVARDRGLKFLYHKATEGDGWVDDAYSTRRKQAATAGLPFGGYHFARPDVTDAAKEARHFLKVCAPKPGDLVPALDLEVQERMSIKALKQWSLDFSRAVEDAVGVIPVLYSPWEFALPEQVKWVPRYNDGMVEPTVPWDIWQFSNGVLGKPDQFFGLGHVDLNTFAKGMTMKHLRIPKPTLADENVPMAHVSLQFSDSPKQQQSDADKVFARAQKQGLWWVTGTEAGGTSPLEDILKATAPRYGYRIYSPEGTDSWIAVRREVMTTKRWDTEYEKVIPGEAGLYAGKGPVSVGFDTRLGPITVIACHYLTRGRPSADTAEYRKNVAINQELALAIGAKARQFGGGKALVFYGGDQNIVDRIDDTFFGEPLTSCWDELQRWQNTGHGNIDVIASYDRDGRVECVSARALNDTRLPLYTDHFWVEAIYSIGALA